jgi:hypothetical protein
MLPTLATDNILPALPMHRMLPALPMLRILPALPIERMLPALPILRVLPLLVPLAFSTADFLHYTGQTARCDRMVVNWTKCRFIPNPHDGYTYNPSPSPLPTGKGHSLFGGCPRSLLYIV